MLTFVLVMAAAALAIGFVAWPLRGSAASGGDEIDAALVDAVDRARLAKDRKLDEIRELRADRAAGKITAEDAAPQERRLRAQAADLLHALDEAESALDAAIAELPERPEPSAAAPTRPRPADLRSAHPSAPATQPGTDQVR